MTTEGAPLAFPGPPSKGRKPAGARDHDNDSGLDSLPAGRALCPVSPSVDCAGGIVATGPGPPGDPSDVHYVWSATLSMARVGASFPARSTSLSHHHRRARVRRSAESLVATP